MLDDIIVFSLEAKLQVSATSLLAFSMTVTEEDEAYAIACEVATMEFVRQKLGAGSFPCVYAYEGVCTHLAAHPRAGFYENTL